MASLDVRACGLGGMPTFVQRTKQGRRSADPEISRPVALPERSVHLSAIML